MTNWHVFLIFPRKQDLTFHANCLQFAWNVKSCFKKKMGTICMKCQILFSGEGGGGGGGGGEWGQFAWNVKSCFLGKIRKMEAICMKCQILFSQKNKIRIFQNVICWNFHPACMLKGKVTLIKNKYLKWKTFTNFTFQAVIRAWNICQS